MYKLIFPKGAKPHTKSVGGARAGGAPPGSANVVDCLNVTLTKNTTSNIWGRGYIAQLQCHCDLKR